MLKGSLKTKKYSKESASSYRMDQHIDDKINRESFLRVLPVAFDDGGSLARTEQVGGGQRACCSAPSHLYSCQRTASLNILKAKSGVAGLGSAWVSVIG